MVTLDPGSCNLRLLNLESEQETKERLYSHAIQLSLQHNKVLSMLKVWTLALPFSDSLGISWPTRWSNVLRHFNDGKINSQSYVRMAAQFPGDRPFPESLLRWYVEYTGKSRAAVVNG